ncbi:MAG: NAD-dependent epimerase/dehydratase family protein [Eubacteriales bacterium]|nr:NAD-dependent epimerase/dehydratase family protein [Eubacteriales bacterium]
MHIEEKKILITGSSGFIGTNLTNELKNRKFKTIFLANSSTNKDLLTQYVLNCDFIFFLHGCMRTKNDDDFFNINYKYIKDILDIIVLNNKKIPIMYASSKQVLLDTYYAKSKLNAENAIIEYGIENKSPVYIYRFTNIFGKFARPNVHSVVATFCFNIQNNIDIKINDPNAVVTFLYIDDVIVELVNLLYGGGWRNQIVKSHK